MLCPSQSQSQSHRHRPQPSKKVAPFPTSTYGGAGCRAARHPSGGHGSSRELQPESVNAFRNHHRAAQAQPKSRRFMGIIASTSATCICLSPSTNCLLRVTTTGTVDLDTSLLHVPCTYLPLIYIVVIDRVNCFSFVIN